MSNAEYLIVLFITAHFTSLLLNIYSNNSITINDPHFPDGSIINPEKYRII